MVKMSCLISMAEYLKLFFFLIEMFENILESELL